MGDTRPIGFFDSGVGGLTVLRAALRRLPRELTVYLGDNGRAPYGTRSDEEVVRFTTECLDELSHHDVKAIVVACNTASSVALGRLRERYTVPLLGVVRPGATAAALATRTRSVAVIATPATVRSHAYHRAIVEEDAGISVLEHATPELVPLVESGRLDGPEVRAVVGEALAPLHVPSDLSAARPVDTLLLGCTHYPLLGRVIRELVGPSVAVIDSATATASALAALLEVDGIPAPAGTPATHRHLTTGDVDAFASTARRLFGDASPEVEGVVIGAGGPAPSLAGSR